MEIGVISDTHDDMEKIARAVDLMNERGVARVIHAGDIVSPFTFEVLGGLRAQFTGVFGNNDGDRLLLREKSRGALHNQPLFLTIEGRKIVVLHEPDLVEPLARGGEFDVVIYGHSHKPDIRKVGNTLVVNPGKTARLHKGSSTAAVLDLRRLEAEIIGL
ncbi:MAG: metallophosphoesterase [Thermodesulfovibrionales bacterium]